MQMLSAHARELQCGCWSRCVWFDHKCSHCQADNSDRVNVYDMSGFLQFHMHVTGRCLAVSGM